MQVIRDSKLIVVDLFTDQSEVLPVFELMYRQAYRGFIPNYDYLTPNESSLLDALWDRFNHFSLYENPTITAIMGTMSFTVIARGLFDPTVFIEIDETGRKE